MRTDRIAGGAFEPAQAATVAAMKRCGRRSARHLNRFLVFGFGLVLTLAAAACQTQIEVDGAGFGSAGDASALFDVASSSVVFIETADLTTGSGIVIDDQWIVTNEHVVGRFDEVRIGTSTGLDLGLQKVHATDPVLDLAIIGPISDDGLDPIARGESAELRIGEEIYLLGYPDESVENPVPTLTRGIVSNRRSIALGEFPFLQVDALIAPGQSGGALLNDRGELVGISGLGFGVGQFGLVLESDPMWPRVDQLIANGRTSASESGQTEITYDIGSYRYFAARIEVSGDEALNVSALGDADLFIELQTLGGGRVYDYDPDIDFFEEPGPNEEEGDPYYADNVFEGNELLQVEVEPGTYVVVVGSFSTEPDDVTIESSVPMVAFVDAEEGASLPTGEIAEGIFDWANDSDRWNLELNKGDQVTIVADGIADTVIAVRFDGDTVAANDDGRFGLFGTASRVSFTAKAEGTYEVEVGTFDVTRTGYLIEVTVE